MTNHGSPRRHSRLGSEHAGLASHTVRLAGWTKISLSDNPRLRSNSLPVGARNVRSDGRIKRKRNFNARPASCNEYTGSSNTKSPGRIKKCCGRNVRPTGRNETVAVGRACLGGRNGTTDRRSSLAPNQELRQGRRMGRPSGRMEQSASPVLRSLMLAPAEATMVLRPSAGQRFRSRQTLPAAAASVSL